MRRCWWILGITTLLAGGVRPGWAQAGPSDGEKLYFPECPRFARDYAFDCYHTYREVTRFLRDAAAAYSEFARLQSMGKSYQGRDLWVITITDFATGAAEDKPGVWVDGGIDADEVIATEGALGLVHRLLTAEDEEVRELVRTRTFYVAPAVIPDASEVHHTTAERPRDTTLRPWDDDGDGLLDEDGPEDLDGDREALQMRRVDPAGQMVADERDPRAMRTRRPGDAGPFYVVYVEGIDNDGDGEYGEDRLGGVDPNRNYPGNWSINQRGSGPFAGSELELRAMLDFVLAHPDIAASQHLHSSGGVILHPPSVPDVSLLEPDQELYLALSRRGLEVTGYFLATSVFDWNWPRGSRNNRHGQVYRDPVGDIRGWPIGSNDDAYPAFGGSIDAMYELFGVLAFANEMYQMGEDLDGDGRIDDVERLKYDDDEMDGAVFKEWTRFEHPQLGAVEIGGWRKFGQNNPLRDRLSDEVRRNVDFILMQAAHTPDLELSSLSADDLGSGVYRVKATVANTGFQPTELAARSRNGRAVPVRVLLEGGDGVELLSSEARVSLGVLAGHSDEEIEWLVRAPGGATVTVIARHPKGGVAAESVSLGGIDR